MQRLNREGVEAVRKKQYEKAENFFYKAYLFDPADPFTLNNLGYVAELRGDLDHALKFYNLASKQGAHAVIDRSSAKQLEGKPITYALTNIEDVPMRVNHMNVQAIQLLTEKRNVEAAQLLHQALALDPNNAFTLNNLGVAEEADGDYATAMQHYIAAANSHSVEPVVITLKSSWRGKPVSQMAADSAGLLQQKIAGFASSPERASLLLSQGVSAANRNDLVGARQNFLKAYTLDPNSGFALNNRGWVAEQEGDIETAQFYYAKARRAEDSGARIGLATARDAEGKRLEVIADGSATRLDSAIDQLSQSRRQQTGPVELRRRDNTPVIRPAPPANPPSANPSNSTQPPAQPQQ